MKTQLLCKSLAELKVFPGYQTWFDKLEFPLERRAQKKGKRRWPRIEIGGDSMRVGKTTAMEVLAKALRNKGIALVSEDEDWKSNPYLAASYQNPKKTLLFSQQWFVRRKYEQLQELQKSSKCTLQCVNPEMDYGYAVTSMLLGRLSQGQFAEYDKFYRSLDWKKIYQPDILVYLTATPEMLVDRATKSVRDFEIVDVNYFLVMQHVNQTWVTKAHGNYNVLVVQTDNLNFSESSKAKEELVNMMLGELKRLGWKMS